MATAKKAAAVKGGEGKASTAKSSPAKPKASESKALKIGATWSIEATGRVLITRPDGSSCVVESKGKTASHVVNQAGTYRAEAGDQVTTVEVS